MSTVKMLRHSHTHTHFLDAILTENHMDDVEGEDVDGK